MEEKWIYNGENQQSQRLFSLEKINKIDKLGQRENRLSVSELNRYCRLLSGQ